MNAKVCGILPLFILFLVSGIYLAIIFQDMFQRLLVILNIS